MPNINNRTIFEADDLNILRRVNSESIDLTLPGPRHSSLTGTMRRADHPDHNILAINFFTILLIHQSKYTLLPPTFVLLHLRFNRQS